MIVEFKWNVNESLVEKTFKLMGEFEQGEQHVVITECFKAQRKLEYRFGICKSTKCTLVYEKEGFQKNPIDLMCALLRRHQDFSKRSQFYVREGVYIS
jgi:hypothetical protein